VAAKPARLLVVVVVPRKTEKMHPSEFQAMVVWVSSLEFLERISFTV
jgi:hypothetical protein